jgi:thiol-disulfide isomerase/thioredoxin
MTTACAALLLFAAVAAADAPTPAVRLRQLRAESDAIEKTFINDLRADRTREGVDRANAKYRAAWAAWQAAALAAVRQNPGRPEAFDVIAAVLAGSGTDVPELVGLLRKHHAARPDLGTLFHSLVQAGQDDGRKFIEERAENSPVEAVRAQAAYALGWQAKWRITRDGNEGLGFGTRLTPDDRSRLEARAVKYFTAAARYDDIPMAFGRGKVGPTARADLLGLKNLAVLRVGQVAPDIEGEAVVGAKLKLSDFRGKVTVLVFWASWCGPCMRMVPREKELLERMKGNPFALVGVNGDDDRTKAEAAVKKHGIPWRSFWDAAERRDGPITRAWNVHGWPTVYVLDEKGVIRAVGHSDIRLDEIVDGLIGRAENR